MVTTPEGTTVMIHEGELTNLLKYDDSEVDYSRGDTMYSIAINPDIEEWLSAVGKYSKYRFKDIAVTYSPAVPTTVSGKLIGFFETDIDDPLLGDDGEETIRRAMANVTAAQVDIWTQHTWLKSFRHEANDWWYTGSTYHEPRTAFQGRFVLIAGSDMTDEELPESLGDLTVTYRVEMMTPDLNIASTSGNQVAYTTSGGGSITLHGPTCSNRVSGMMRSILITRFQTALLSSARAMCVSNHPSGTTECVHP
jgi:hypothetical protein